MEDKNIFSVWLNSKDLSLRKKAASDKKFSPTNIQIAKGLKDSSPIIRYMFISRDDVKLNKNQIDEITKDECNNVKLALIFKKNVKLTNEQIAVLYNTNNRDIIAALLVNSFLNNYPFTDKDIENILTSSRHRIQESFISKMELSIYQHKIKELKKYRPSVRKAILSKMTEVRNISKLSRYQKEAFLLDVIPEIRGIWRYRNNEDFSLYQIKRGIRDQNDGVKLDFYNLDSFKLDASQIAIGLNEENPIIRHSIIYRSDVTLTKEQIERYIKDRYSMVREAIADNVKTLTKEQADLLFADKFEGVRYAVLDKDYFIPTQEQIKAAINDKCEMIRELLVVKRTDVQFNNLQIAQLLKDSSFRVRAALFRRENIKLTREQIEDGLTSPDNSVRASVAGRKDIKLTEEQIDRGLKDKDMDVRMMFEKIRDMYKNNTPEFRIFYPLIDIGKLYKNDKKGTIAKNVENIILYRASQYKKNTDSLAPLKCICPI